ncbi:hypothetical protein DL96DRAFT_1598720 [Flagelloscypha sp. PMI_526]|nr:hypothetical protein DL96DRAFT_1598720 [Flagelloscypha sp. PMI_526]
MPSDNLLLVSSFTISPLGSMSYSDSSTNIHSLACGLGDAGACGELSSDSHVGLLSPKTTCLVYHSEQSFELEASMEDATANRIDDPQSILTDPARCYDRNPPGLDTKRKRQTPPALPPRPLPLQDVPPLPLKHLFPRYFMADCHGSLLVPKARSMYRRSRAVSVPTPLRSSFTKDTLAEEERTSKLRPYSDGDLLAADIRKLSMSLMVTGWSRDDISLLDHGIFG